MNEVSVTGTDDLPHGYCGYGSRILRICLTGTDDLPHEYAEYPQESLGIDTTSAHITCCGKSLRSLIDNSGL